MKPSERDKLTQETHQALLGIKGTEDNGLVGDVREMKRDIKEMNGTIKLNTTDIAVLKERNKPSKKTIGGLLTGAIALAVALWKAFTNGG